MTEIEAVYVEAKGGDIGEAVTAKIEVFMSLGYTLREVHFHSVKVNDRYDQPVALVIFERFSIPAGQ